MAMILGHDCCVLAPPSMAIPSVAKRIFRMRTRYTPAGDDDDDGGGGGGGGASRHEEAVSPR